MELYDEDEDLPKTRGPRHAPRVPDDVATDIHQRMAALTVRRKANRHDCDATATTPCTHPNHRRDVDSLFSDDKEHPGLFEMLGLDTAFPTVTDAERRTWLRWIGQSGPAEDIAA